MAPFHVQLRLYICCFKFEFASQAYIQIFQHTHRIAVRTVTGLAGALTTCYCMSGHLPSIRRFIGLLSIKLSACLPSCLVMCASAQTGLTCRHPARCRLGILWSRLACPRSFWVVFSCCGICRLAVTLTNLISPYLSLSGPAVRLPGLPLHCLARF